jgi:5'-methylthioadenosine phosphorylase
MDERIAIIGGSGLGNALLAQTRGQNVELDTPFGRPSAPLVLSEIAGVPIAFLARHGIGHTLNPSQVPYRANLFALKSVGCRWVIASGAVGSLQEEIRPRDLVLVDQVIDKTYRRVGTFFDNAAVHVEMSEPFCPVLRQILQDTAHATTYAASAAPRVHATGTYVCMEGPAFSTRAESLLHKSWGADLIGMTAMPEARLAREAEMALALVALATDYDCWKPHTPGQSKQALLAEIISHLEAATANALALIKAALPRVWESRTQEVPAHRALELAIWSDRTKIAAAERQRLSVLWGRYLPGAAS